jgi:hypothetical protein
LKMPPYSVGDSGRDMNPKFACLIDLLLSPSYSPAHESAQLDDNVCWMLRSARMRSR